MNSFDAHYGHWTLVALMVVLVSWILYRHLAPKSWREWTGAGVLQAFVIALYAEMYGFPLTIYLLTGFFGLDLKLDGYSGHLWATLLGYEAAGAMIEMVLGFTLVFAGLALLIAGWRQVYRADHEGRLATSGLYAFVRHPQYTGIMLAIFGQVVHWPTIPTLVLFPVIVLLYVWLAKREERRLVAQFGDEYVRYRERTPMFFPRLGQWKRLFREVRSS